MSNRILTFLFITCWLSNAAQTSNNKVYKEWRIDEKGSLTWQHVYEDSAITRNDILKHLRKFSWIRDIEQIEGDIYANAHHYMIDGRKHELFSGLPSVLEEAKWNWSITINYKKGKYRVLVRSIVYDWGVKRDKDFTWVYRGPFEAEVLTRDRPDFKTSQLEHLDILGYDLKSIFLIQKETSSADW